MMMMAAPDGSGPSTWQAADDDRPTGGRSRSRSTSPGPHPTAKRVKTDSTSPHGDRRVSEATHTPSNAPVFSLTGPDERVHRRELDPRTVSSPSVLARAWLFSR